MEESVKNRKWNVDQYLERIHMERPTVLDREYLDQLMIHHLMYVPFENMDLYFGLADISQDLDELFDKIVLRRRGGYCFELNKTFQALLKDLGFDTYPCFCRMQRGRNDMPGPIRHRGNIIRLNGDTYFCDVGYGNAMSRGALKLVPQIRQTRGSDIYWFEKYADCWYSIYRQQQDLIYEDGTVVKGETSCEMRVCTAPMEEVDFEPLNDITNGPDSVFRSRIMVGRLTENGALAINGDLIFSRTEGNRKTHRKLKDEAELHQVLRDEFGIVL